MTAAAQGDALMGLWFVGQKYYPVRTADWLHQPGLPVFARLRRYLAGYFSGDTGAPDVPLAPAGTPFQHAVWDILLLIPSGRVTTYGRIAQQIARAGGLAPASARSVGGAVGHNPISILIPCHRVVGANGSLTGYAGGIERKSALLQGEKAAMKPIDIGAYISDRSHARRQFS